jgi:TetR/AcrR family transcriptional regulator, repressor for uid operon
MSLLATLPAEDETSPQDARRAQILDAARVCFARSGFRGASMQQICAEAKMSPGALYRYFPSKEVIIEAIAADERLKAAAVLEVFRDPGPIVDRLMRAANAYFALMNRPGGGELMIEICSESTRNSTVGDRFQCIEADVQVEFTAALKASQEGGEIDPTVDVEAVVVLLMAIADGIVIRMNMNKSMDTARLLPGFRRAIVGLLTPREIPGDASGS